MELLHNTGPLISYIPRLHFLYIYSSKVMLRKKKINKKWYRFLLDGLTAPLGSGCQEPGDGEYDPPHDSSNREEVQKHKKQGAAFALRAQHHSIHARRLSCCGAGSIVPQQEPYEVYERNEAIADRVEDYGAFWVSKTFDVDEKREEGEERGS